ncbi:MAG: hypothetical protein ABIL16_03840 [candidate division WOR-3 bacterium]
MVLNESILQLELEDKWNVWFTLRDYPLVDLREVSLESGQPISSLRRTAEYLKLMGYLDVLSGDSFRFKCSEEEVKVLKKMLEENLMRDWEFNDCHRLYCDLENYERKIINRLVFSSSKVGVRVLMELIGSKGYFKILNFERKLSQFSKENGLFVPICKDKSIRRKSITFYKVCSDSFRDNMKKVIEAFKL